LLSFAKVSSTILITEIDFCPVSKAKPIPTRVKGVKGGVRAIVNIPGNTICTPPTTNAPIPTVLVVTNPIQSLAACIFSCRSIRLSRVLVLASKNSDAITKSLGKQINSFADLEVAYPGLSRSEVAMSAIKSMEKQTAQNLMFNLSEKLGPVNLNNLKSFFYFLVNFRS
jgi:hypothetical protein